MQEVFGRYTLLSRLGYGGMAEVFLARTNSVAGFEKLLAIKRLLPHCVEDQQTVDLLADEARITVQLTHPNIVQVFDFGRVQDSYFIAMEYVDGVDLKTLVQIDEDTSTPLPLDVALQTAIAILDGLDFAHNRTDPVGQPLGIIHRDISPHNVLISRHGQVKLTDFGVARARISIHVSIVGDIRGKFSYMPPEQACGGEIDHRVDIFAAGAILYELLAGRQPFRSTSTGEQMKLLSSAVLPPSRFMSDLPRGLDSIVLRALNNDPQERYPSAKGFADALRAQYDRHCKVDPQRATQKLADLVEQRLDEIGEETPLDEPANMMSRDDFGVSPDHSLIEYDEPPRAIGELQGISTRTDETIPDEPTVAFSDAMVARAARGESLHAAKTEIMPHPPRGAEDLAFAATDVALDLAALGLERMPTEDEAPKPSPRHVFFDDDDDGPTRVARSVLDEVPGPRQRRDDAEDPVRHDGDAPLDPEEFRPSAPPDGRYAQASAGGADRPPVRRVLSRARVETPDEVYVEDVLSEGPEPGPPTPGLPREGKRPRKRPWALIVLGVLFALGLLLLFAAVVMWE